MAKNNEKTPAAAPAAEEPKTAVAVQEQATGNTALAEYDYGNDAGAGMENVGKDEFKIPLLRILDPKSPQVKPVANGGIPGAKAGDIFNTGTNEVYDGLTKGMIFVPCARDHKFIEFIKKNDDGSGGGFVGIREPDDNLVLMLREKHGKFGKLPVPDTDHELSETFSLAVIAIPVLEPAVAGKEAVFGQAFKAIIAFSSTQIKKYQSFIGRVMGIQYQVSDNPPKFVNPPLWAHRWHVKTQYEQKGQLSWYGWVLTLAEKNPDGSEAPTIKSRLSTKDPLYIAGKDFYNLVNEGKTKVDYTKADAAPAGDPGGEIPM